MTTKLGPVTYRLQLPPTYKCHNVFHADVLKLFKGESAQFDAKLRPTATPDAPPPDVIDEEEHFHVQAIKGHRIRRKQLELLCSYTGHGPQDDEWVLASRMQTDMHAEAEKTGEIVAHPLRVLLEEYVRTANVQLNAKQPNTQALARLLPRLKDATYLAEG